MTKHDKIFVTGHRGLVGAAILRRLAAGGYTNPVTRSHAELDLTRQEPVEAFFAQECPDIVFLAAGKVGGILANDRYPVDFLRDNLLIETHVIDAAWRNGTRKLIFLGSSCIYPKFAPQPMPETCLLSGELEPTNQWYAIAKIAGIKLCQAYRRQYGFNAIALMPTNLYGPGDNFSLEDSHVLPALIRKFHEAKVNREEQVRVWGSGRPRREFLHVEDLADAAVFLAETYNGDDIVNVGVGQDISIAELVDTIRSIVGFSGDVVFDPDKPDGTPRKLLDVSRLTAMGWQARIGLKEGIRTTYAWFLEDQHVGCAEERSASYAG